MVLQLTTPPPKKKCSTEPSTQNSTLQKWEALEKMAFSHMYVQMFTACVCVYIYMYTVCMYIYISNYHYKEPLVNVSYTLDFA